MNANPDINVKCKTTIKQRFKKGDVVELTNKGSRGVRLYVVSDKEYGSLRKVELTAFGELAGFLKKPIATSSVYDNNTCNLKLIKNRYVI